MVAADLDKDLTNELVDSFIFDRGTKAVQLTDAGGLHIAQLAGIATETFVVDKVNELDNKDQDKDSTNELITATGFDLPGQTISVTDQGQTHNIALTGMASEGFVTTKVDELDTNDKDKDPANELITTTNFDLTGKTITVTDQGQSHNIALTGMATEGFVTSKMDELDSNDGDKSPTNELQQLSQSGSNVTLSQNGGSININDADANASNELQSLNQSGSIVTLSGGGGSISINDNDSSRSNEIQTLSKSGSTVTLSRNGGSVSVKEQIRAYSNKKRRIVRRFSHPFRKPLQSPYSSKKLLNCSEREG